MATTEHVVQQQASPAESPSPVTPELLSPRSGTLVPQKRALQSATPQASNARQKTKVTRACDICKSKKSKCSGEQPCDTCNRRGLLCQYEAIYLRGKAPPPRRIESLDHTAALYPHTILNSIDAPPEPDASSLAPLPSIAPRPGDSPVEAAQDIPSRGSPGLEVAGQYSDPTSGLSFLHRAWRRISNNENSQVMNGQLASVEYNQLLQCAGDKPFQETGQVRIPSLGKSREMFTVYFDVCIATYRLIHRPTVESWLEKVTHNVQFNRHLSFGLGRAKAAVVLAVLAVASLHEEKTRGNSGFSPVNEVTMHSPSDELFSEAARLTQTETGIPKLESAQSRLIQVLYLLQSSRFNQAWYTFGQSLQIISALGLHRRDDRKRAPTPQKRDYIDEQCRKRTFWVAYILDKYLSVVLGRPQHYHDDDIDQDLPDAVNDEDMTSSGPRPNNTEDCHLDALVFHAKYAQIAARISREVYSIKPVPDHVRLAASHRLAAELRQWRASLPPFLGAINPSSLIPTFRRQATALKLSYCHAVMLAHRPFLLTNLTRNNEGMRSLAREGRAECISAAQSALETVDRMAREGRLFHAFWWTHYVCFCALVVVYVWAIQESNNSSTMEESSAILEQAERCLQHLAQATASNSPSRKYSIILQELRAEAKRKTARPMPEHAHVLSPSTAHMLGGDQPNARHGSVNDLAVHGADPALQTWQPLFGSPIDTSIPGLRNLLDDWQTTDWLHLDSSAFGPFPEFDTASLTWM